jgi:DNA-binding HxlR family transcriptional regulator
MSQARARRKKGAEAAVAVISVLSQKWKLIIVQTITPVL